jgi:hypothetical protein
MGGDLEGAARHPATDGPEALALQPHRLRDGAHEVLDLVGTGVGGEVVVVALLDGAPEEQVAHDAPDEVHAVAGGLEALGNRSELGEHRGEPLGDHGTTLR